MAFPDTCFREKRVSYSQFGRRFFFLSAPDDVNHVLNTHMHRYQPNILTRRLLQPILGRGLIFAEGAEWRRQHGQLAPFFRAKSLEHLTAGIDDTVAAYMSNWSAGPQERDLLADFRTLTIAVIARSLLSIDDEKETGMLAAFAAEAESEGTLLEWQDYFALFVSARIGQPRRRLAIAQRWRDWIGKIVDDREGLPLPNEWDMIKQLRSGADGDCESAPREEIVDQVGTMLSSGFITTALALFWTVVELASSHEQQTAVRNELCSPSGETPAWTTLRASVSATAFLHESLRLHPPVFMIVRETVADDELEGTLIPRGATVVVSPWIAHRHHAYWKNPDRFDPGRFLEGERLVPREAWMPFGVGPRVCIASAFATTEVLIVLRRLLMRYRIDLDGQVPAPVGRITLMPSFPARFRLTPL